MRRPLSLLRDRVAPVVLTAAGVTLLAAGLLHYSSNVDAGGFAGTSPRPSGGPAASAPTFLVPSLPPVDGSPGSSAPGPSSNPHRVATRIVIEALEIDLPIVVQPNSGYP